MPRNGLGNIANTQMKKALLKNETEQLERDGITTTMIALTVSAVTT
jgi:hypothetical protein